MNQRDLRCAVSGDTPIFTPLFIIYEREGTQHSWAIE